MSNSHFDPKFTLSNGKDETGPFPQHRPPESVMRTLKRKKRRNGQSQSHPNLDKFQSILGMEDGDKRNLKYKQLVTDSQLQNLHAITKKNKDGNVTQVRFNQSNGTLNMIKIKKPEIRKGGRYRDLNESGKAVENFLTENHRLLKLAEPLKELRTKKQWQDELCLKHYRYQQTYKGIPIWGREVMVHEDSEDSVYLFQGCYEPTPQDIDINPIITANEALAAAMKHLGITEQGSEPVEKNLVIYTNEGGQKALAYKVEISPSLDQSWIYFIDAKNGSFIHRISNIQNALVTASGTDLSGNVRSFNAWFDGSQYNLIDPTFPLDDTPYSPIPTKNFGNTYICFYYNILDQYRLINSFFIDSG